MKIQHDPTLYNIPHPSWRPNQREMFQKCVDAYFANIPVMIAELGTGSGKSAIATGLSFFDQVTVLVSTLGLSDQYVDNYGFVTIKGRQEYPCAHAEKINKWMYERKITPTAYDCHYEKMTDCPYAHECEYITQKHIALSSSKMVCTYRYASLSYNVQERPGILVMDEVHDSVEEIISHREFTVRSSFSDLGVTPFPIKASGSNGKGNILDGEQLKIVMIWLKNNIERMSQYSEDELESPTGARIIRLQKRMSSLYLNLHNQPYFISTSENEPALKALRATEAYFAISYKKRFNLMMSATIGNPEPLTHELGIPEKDYKFISFPHPIPPEVRPIEVLPAPLMTHRELTKNPSLYTIQAIVIANWINNFPETWRGIVLTTSFYKIQKLAELLPLRVTGKRRFIIQKGSESLSDLIQTFITDVRMSDIAIGTIQGWGTGLDLRDDLARWIVVAGVPHQNPTDLYAKARRQLSGGQRYQLWYTYNKIPQAAGRVSRGERDENGDWLVSYAALADKSAITGRAKSFYPKWFMEAWK